MVKVTQKGRKKELIPEKYYEVINYFINTNNKKRHPQQICRGIYGSKKYKPGEKGSHYSNIRKKCKDLLKIGMLKSERKISKPKTSFKADYYWINDNININYFKEIAKNYLSEEELREHYEKLVGRKPTFKNYRKERKLSFMEFAQDVIDKDFIEHCCNDLNIEFQGADKLIFPVLFANFPSALYEALFHKHIPAKDLDTKGKMPSEEMQRYGRFASLIQIAVFIDLGRGEHLIPEWLARIDVRTKTTMYPSVEIDPTDCNLEELKTICRQKGIKFIKSDNEEILKRKLFKKIKKGEKIVVKGEDKYILDSGVFSELT